MHATAAPVQPCRSVHAPALTERMAACLYRGVAQVGELSLGKIDVPHPKDQNASVRIRFDAPVRCELHWKAFGAPASKGQDDWEEEEEPIYLPPSPSRWGSFM